jgi:nitrous oxide reductase accessory protein NosL
MNKILLALLMVIGLFSFSEAQMKCGEGKCGSAMMSGKTMDKKFQSVDKDKATILQKGKDSLSCPKCGMNLPKFYKTNHSAKVGKDVKQYCSIHCLLADIKSGSKVEDIKVVDTNSLKFISAKDAFYVVGSSKGGTMSKVSKYAFASKDDAKSFAKKNGGDILTFTEALKKAEDDFNKK